MYISIKEDNQLYKNFNRLRKLNGFTTFTSAIREAMSLFVKDYEDDNLRTTKSKTAEGITFSSGMDTV